MSFFFGVMSASDLGQGVEFVQLGLQQLLVRQPGLVLGDEGRRQRPAQGVLDDLVVLAGAEQHADRRALVRLADVAVEGLQVELQLAEVLGLELADLELDGDQAVQAAVEEEQVEGEVLPPTWSGTSLPMKQKSRPSSVRKRRRFRPGSRAGRPRDGRRAGRGTRRGRCRGRPPRRRGAILSALLRLLAETGRRARTGRRRAGARALALAQRSRSGHPEVELTLLGPLAPAQDEQVDGSTAIVSPVVRLSRPRGRSRRTAASERGWAG